MGYNVKQNADGSTSFVNALTSTEVLAMDEDDHVSITSSSDSTSGSSSVEPLVLNSTMSGAGGVGGRFKSKLTATAALGGWANAIKGETDFTDGSVTGLGSAVLAEMTLSSNTSSGTYAPVEIELNMPSSASTGTTSSLIYGSVNGDDKATFDTSGYLLNLAGVTEGDSKLFNAHTLGNINEVTHGLKVKVAGSDYYILMAQSSNFVD